METKLNNHPEILALIPAKSTSERVPGKNIKKLNGHPLIAYAISAAIDSGIFKRVIVSTDDLKTTEIAKTYGAEVPFLRPSKYATKHSPDIEWLKHLLEELYKLGETAECYSILRPINPFRQPDTIKRAWEQFFSEKKVDSLRAVEKCKEHPAKMWIIDNNRMRPVIQNPNPTDIPWHSKQYQSLPAIYAQNASLEIAWSSVPLEKNSISGDAIMPFFTQGHEGFDINLPEDWIVAEHLVKTGEAKLPEIKI